MASSSVAEVYRCSLCDCAYFTKDNLKETYLELTKETYYQCAECMEKHHIAQNTTKPKKKRTFQCVLCKVTFLSRENIKVHYLNGTKEKYYQCKDCIQKSQIREALPGETLTEDLLNN